MSDGAEKSLAYALNLTDTYAGLVAILVPLALCQHLQLPGEHRARLSVPISTTVI